MPDFPRLRYAAAPDFPFPDFAGQDFVESIETTTGAAEDTRYDTAGSHLERAGMDLYRRKDASGAGWYLALRSDGRVMAFDSKATTPPREVSAVLTGTRGGQRLVASERVSGEWDSHQLLDGAGGLVASIHDTLHTRSHPAGDFETEAWREIEIDFDPAASKASRKAVRKLLKSVGAKEVGRSRLDRSDQGQREQAARKGLAGLVETYVQDQLSEIASGDFELRSDGSGVHDTRVAIRRLRSTLHVFDDVFDETKATALTGELSWFAGLLGQVRDADVAGRAVAELLETAPDSLSTASARLYAEQSGAAKRAAGYDALATAMTGRRYSALVTTLEEWRVDAPYLEAAAQPGKAARRYVAQTQAKLHKRLRSATKKGAEVDEVHRARKVAKRLRYAAELAGPALPKGGAAEQKEGKRWQRTLGDLQDLRITADLLTQLADSAPTSEDAFVLGTLWARTKQASERSYATLVRKVR